MIKYIDLKFRSNRKEVKVGRGGSYKLLSIDGISSANINLNTKENNRADGSRVDDIRVVSRDINIEAEYSGRDSDDVRNSLVSFFNPHLEGVLEINLNGIKRSIVYNVENFSAPIVNLYNPLKFLIQLHCPNAYWEDDVILGRELANWIGGMKFPIQLPMQFAMAGDRVANIVNTGDVATPLKFELHGRATNPVIRNKLTGEFIKIDTLIDDGDVLVITTDIGSKKVMQNGVNVSQYMDLDSTFLHLNVGDNVIELTTDDVADSPRLKVSYRNKYIGV